MSIKTKTRKEIAHEYGIDRKTLYRWLKKENIQLKRTLVTPKEQKKIYVTFGFPCIMTPEEQKYFSEKLIIE